MRHLIIALTVTAIVVPPDILLVLDAGPNAESIAYGWIAGLWTWFMLWVLGEMLWDEITQ
jgi:hypothetical protein